MRAGTFLSAYRLIQAFRRTVSSTSSTVNTVPFRFNFLCTHTLDNSSANVVESELEAPKCLSLRIERIPKGESVGYAFSSWMGDGFPVHRGDIFHAINRLRKLERNKRALEVAIFFISLFKAPFSFPVFLDIVNSNRYHSRVGCTVPTSFFLYL